MFVVKVSGEWGSCYVDNNNEPTMEKNKGAKFLTRQDAATYIMENYKAWKEIKKGHETMTVEQM